MKHKLIICISALCLGLAGNVQAQNKKMYRNGWIDFNKNGVKDIYEDPSQPVEKRVADLLSQMSVVFSSTDIWKRKPANWQPFTATDVC